MYEYEHWCNVLIRYKYGNVNYGLWLSCSAHVFRRTFAVGMHWMPWKRDRKASWTRCWAVFEIKSRYQANVTLPRSTFSTSLWTSIMLSEIFQTRIYTPLEDLPLFWQKFVQQMDMPRVIKYKIFFQNHFIARHLPAFESKFVRIYSHIFQCLLVI